MDRSTMGRWRRWSAWNCGSRARLRCSRRIWSCSPTTSLRPLVEVVHRARSGQVAQIAPNVARPAVLIGRVTSAGQVAVRAVWSTVKSSMVSPPVTGRWIGIGLIRATRPAEVTRPISTAGRATFGAICATCPLRARCTTSARGRKLVVGEHDQIRREHRKRARDPQFQADYRRHRPMVERSIAWLTRGARRVPYRGVGKNNAWWTLRAASINLRTLLRLGLRLDHGTWATA